MVVSLSVIFLIAKINLHYLFTDKSWTQRQLVDFQVNEKVYIVVLMMMFACEVYFADEKGVVVSSIDEFNRIRSFIIRNEKD